MVNIEWKESRITNGGNQYFHYPKGDMEFKDEVVKSGGWVAHIYKNGIFINKIEADSSVVWQSPIFTHIKTTTINSKDIEQIYENCKIYAVPKGYEDMLPPKGTKTDFDKDKFLNLIKAFMDKVDELRPTGSINGTGKDKWYVIEAMENLLQNIGYEPYFKFGGAGGQLLGGKWDNDAKVCSISFYRKDTIGFLNKKSIGKGVYIWLGYADKEQRDNIKLSISKGWEATECIAIDTIEKHRNNSDWDFIYNSNDFEAQKEQIAKDFLYLVKEFDSIPLEHFKPKGEAMDNKTKTPPLNQILYGPPGTGKTYNTIDKALEILRHYEVIDEIPESREDKRKIFDKYRANKQIEFVTFHQSFSYEEFVEGIKPKLIDSSESAESNEMSYTIKSGIFKEICKKALEELRRFKEEYANLAKKFYGDILKKLKQEQEFSHKGITFELTQQGNEIQTKGSKGQAVWKDEITKLLMLQNSKNLSDDGIKNSIDIDEGFVPLYKAMRDYFFSEYLKGKPKPYILIIDEINRGNISKILGELITLIEPSKRIGSEEELRVTLPYSNDSFGVPSNLYIIGTMNTADRSIALLDTALRRRFEFVEMMPDSSQLKPCGDIDLAQLLDKMNERIEFLLDREHTIGHSFFIGIGSLGKLREVFKLKIIPLLQEYFYDDYVKIDAVLNYNKMVESKSMSDLGVALSDEFVDNDKKVYRITDSNMWKKENFQRIYDSSIKIDENE